MLATLGTILLSIALGAGIVVMALVGLVCVIGVIYDGICALIGKPRPRP